jgi:hypothetical protein
MFLQSLSTVLESTLTAQSGHVSGITLASTHVEVEAALHGVIGALETCHGAIGVKAGAKSSIGFDFKGGLGLDIHAGLDLKALAYVQLSLNQNPADHTVASVSLAGSTSSSLAESRASWPTSSRSSMALSSASPPKSRRSRAA